MMYLRVFLVGGILCAIAQILIDKTSLTPARILVSYVVLGVLLSGIGLYEPLAEFAGAGAGVPLTGFGHNLAKGVEKAMARDGLIGAVSGGLSANAAGISSALILAFLLALICKSKSDK